MNSENSLNVQIPRWALPNERVPMSICWSKSIEWDELRIILPKAVLVDDISNVEHFEYQTEIKTLIIRKIFHTQEKTTENFVVIVVASPKSKSIKKQEKILIRLMNEGVVQSETIGFLRIFRPLMDVDVLPGAGLILSEKIKRNTIPIIMKVQGFGDIRVRVKCTTHCVLDTEAGDLKGSLLKQFLGYLRKKERELPELNLANSKSTEFGVNPNLINELLSELKLIADGAVSADLFTLNDISDAEIEETIPLLNLIEKKMEDWLNTFMYELLIDTGKQYPQETIEVEHYSAILDSNILAEAKQLVLNFNYWDMLDNEYETHKVTIPVLDKRLDKHKHPIIRVEFMPAKWEVKQMKNVEAFKFG